VRGWELWFWHLRCCRQRFPRYGDIHHVRRRSVRYIKPESEKDLNRLTCKGQHVCVPCALCWRLRELAGAIARLKPLRQRASSGTNDNSILVELPTFFVSSSFLKRIETFHYFSASTDRCVANAKRVDHQLRMRCALTSEKLFWMILIASCWYEYNRHAEKRNIYLTYD
jgi:hypothetical protein